MTMRALIGALLLVSLFCNCRKDLINHQIMWDCHTQENLSMDSTEVLMLGAWQWIESECPIFSGSSYIREVFEEDLVLRIGPDKKYEMRKGNHVLRNGTWHLSKPPDGQLFLLESQDSSQSRDLATGFVLLCENQLEINGSYRGACNQFYRRAE